jgi:hypothetical protein
MHALTQIVRASFLKGLASATTFARTLESVPMFASIVDGLLQLMEIELITREDISK